MEMKLQIGTESIIKRYIRTAGIFFGKGINKIGYVLPEPIFRHLHFTGPFEINLPNGSRLRLNSFGNRVENELAWRGWNGHEPAERDRWIKLVNDGGDIFDIGANTGTFAFMAKATSPESRVFAFEPIDRIADLICKNIAVSGISIEIVRAAVSQKTGTLPIYDPGGANAYSASLEPDFLDGENSIYTVPVVSLDSYCAEHDLNPSTIKIDVEGSEGRVLIGSREIISRRNVTFLCEWLGSYDTHRMAIDILRENGYSAIDIHSLEDFNLLSTKGYHDRNVVIAPKEKIMRYRELWNVLT